MIRPSLGIITTRSLVDFDKVSLLLNMDGENDGTRYIDYSLNNFPITRYGSPVTKTGIKKFGNSSSYFNGSTDYLTIPNSSAFDFSCGKWTVEAWVYPINLSSTHTIMSMNSFFFPEPSWSIFINYDDYDTVIIFAVSEYSEVMDASFRSVPLTIDLNTWNHVAVTSNGYNVSMWLNGDLVGEKNITLLKGFAPISIGSFSQDYPLALWNGYIDELRVSRGIERYTSNFTPPTEAFSITELSYDRYFGSTSLLLHMDGNNDGSIYSDASSNNIIINPYGGAVTREDVKKFGTASSYFNGSTDYLSMTDDPLFDLSSGEWTIEGWFYALDLSGTRCIISKDTYGQNYSWSIIVADNGTSLWLYTDEANDSFKISSLTIPLNTWHHIAITSNGSRMIMWFNGQNIGIKNRTVTNAGSSISIGCSSWNNPAEFWSGYIDELRITKGIERYTYDFTPPVTAFLENRPDSDKFFNKISMLLHMNGEDDGTSVLDSSSNGLITSLFGNARTKTIEKRFGTSSLYFDGSGDHLTAAPNSLFSFGSGSFTVEMWLNTPSWGTGGYNDFLGSIIDFRNNASSSSGYLLLFSDSGKLRVWRNRIVLESVSPVPKDEWVHIAFVKGATNRISLYINGNESGTVIDSINLTDNYMAIGAPVDHLISDSVLKYDGYIDELRITKGVDRYVSNFIPADSEFLNR